MPIFRDRPARIADATGLDRRPALTVHPRAIERARDDPRRRGLPDTAHARQHPRMGQPSGFDGVGQCPHHRFLPNQIIKGRGAIFPRQHTINRRRRRGGSQHIGKQRALVRIGRGGFRGGEKFGQKRPRFTQVFPDEQGLTSPLTGKETRSHGRQRQMDLFTFKVGD